MGTGAVSAGTCSGRGDRPWLAGARPSQGAWGTECGDDAAHGPQYVAAGRE